MLAVAYIVVRSSLPQFLRFAAYINIASIKILGSDRFSVADVRAVLNAKVSVRSNYNK